MCMPQLMDMMSQSQSGGNPMKPSQTPSTLQPLAAEPAARNMSGIAQSVMGSMQQMQRGVNPMQPQGVQ